MLKEWLRVLKPGASLSLECPSMDKVFAYIARLVAAGSPRKSQFMTTFSMWGDPKYQDPFMGHKWGYFVDDLMDLMRQAGFDKVESQEPRYHFRIRDMRVTGVKPC